MRASPSGRRSRSYSITLRPLSLTSTATCSTSSDRRSLSTTLRAYTAPLAPVTATIIFFIIQSKSRLFRHGEIRSSCCGRMHLHRSGRVGQPRRRTGDAGRRFAGEPDCSEAESQTHDVFYGTRQCISRIAERLDRIVEYHNRTALHVLRDIAQTLLRRYRRAVILAHDTPHHEPVPFRQHFRLTPANPTVRRPEQVGGHRLGGEVYIAHVLFGRHAPTPDVAVGMVADPVPRIHDGTVEFRVLFRVLSQTEKSR